MVQTPSWRTEPPYAYATYEPMTQPSSPRSKARRHAPLVETRSSLAVNVDAQVDAQADAQVDAQAPSTTSSATSNTRPQPEPDDGTDDPITQGLLSYTKAGPEQQEQARLGLQQRLAAYLSRGRPRIIVTDNLHTMLSIKRGQGVVTFRIHHMFITAPSVVLRAVAHYAERQDRDAANLLREFVDAHDTLIRQRNKPRPITCDVQGRYHNLQDILDELNEHYFDGEIQARITWGPRSRRKRSRDSIKLGSYTVEDELIRIHPVLDAADVPRFFVAWIVYHEMLHEVHDMPVVDGRRVYHTPQFRRAEAQYEHYAESVLWERTNLHKLLER